MKKSHVILIILGFSLILITGSVMANSLAGRVIVLNPGHGGHERGAVGPTGLEEQKINLKVGLYLKEMLEEAGATVYITRTTDKDLDGTNHYSGTRDRFNRLRWGREKNADIFVALHHNASINPESKQIEVYYMPNYYGPSRDLADYVAKGLSESMGINGVPTTFSQVVVNHATIPTIIGEAGYISNPGLEKKYRTDEFLKKEAKGYFEGIKNFFAAGMPEVKPVYPVANAKLTESKPTLVAKILRGGDSPINPDSIRVLLNKKFVNFEYEKETGMIKINTGEELANGPHNLLVVGANRNGIKAVPLDMVFYIDEPPAKINLNSFATWVPDKKETVVKISGRVLDDDGEPVMDGNIVRFELPKGGYFEEKEVFTRNGYFVNYLHRGEYEYAIAPIKIVAGNALEEIVVQWESKEGYLYGHVGDEKTSRDLTGVKIELKGKGQLKSAVTDYAGDFYLTEIRPGTYQIKVLKQGYEELIDSLTVNKEGVYKRNFALKPVAGGVLQKKKIIINIMDSKEIMLPVLEELKSLLEKGGAEVVIIDEKDDKKAVKKVNKLLGQLILSFKTGNDQIVYHYPGSDKYEKLAVNLATKLGGNFTAKGSKNKIITFASTSSFIIESGADLSGKAIYNWIVDYFVNSAE